MYDPSSKDKEKFRKECAEFEPKRPLEGALSVSMIFNMPRPKSHYRTGRYSHLLKSNAPKLHTSALRAWISEYQKKMAQMSGEQEAVPVMLGAEKPHKEGAIVKESVVVLNSVNIAVDGHDITISKSDVVKLMEVFYHFDKQEGKRDDV